jgi:hypothetical protein
MIMQVHDDVMQMRSDQVTRAVAWSKGIVTSLPKEKVKQAQQ